MFNLIHSSSSCSSLRTLPVPCSPNTTNMGKRKSASFEDQMNKRFKKLKEDLLRDKFRRSRIIPLSSSSDSDSEPHNARAGGHDGASSPLVSSPTPPPRRSRSRQKAPSGKTGRPPALPVRQPSPTRDLNSPPSSPGQPITSEVTVTAEIHETPTPGEKDKSVPDIVLDDEILQLLGDAPKVEVALGNPVHKDIADRWQEVLSKGLTKEVRDTLLKEYSVPSNCELLLAPTLNPEAKAALPEVMVKRDTALMYTQKQLGVAISALAVATNLIISKETSTQKILKPISDACRLLCDRHRYETQTRRKFVINSVNSTLKDTLVESSRDKFLFGENLSEKLKAAKTIQRSGEDLKNVAPKTFSKANFAYKPQNKNHTARLGGADPTRERRHRAAAAPAAQPTGTTARRRRRRGGVRGGANV